MIDIRSEVFALPGAGEPLDDFEGFTPAQMHGLLYSPYDEQRSSLRLNNNLDPAAIQESWFYTDTVRFLKAVHKHQPLKLTQKGNLPVRFCRELNDQGLWEDEKTRLFMQRYPCTREQFNFYLHTINIAARVARFTYKKYNRLHVSQRILKYLDARSPWLYTEFFKSYTTRFNWDYLDRYPSSWIVQGGFGYLLFLIQQYGAEPRDAEFYSQKFLRAFPKTMRDFPDTEYSRGVEDFSRCFYLRMFKHFLARFGLVEMEKKDDYDFNPQVKKKELIDLLVTWDTTAPQR